LGVKTKVLKKLFTFLEQVLQWITLRNWRVIAGSTLLILIFELFELSQKNEPLYDPFHIIELLIYIIILIFVGILIKFLTASNNALNHTMEILKNKHSLSLRLTELEDWDSLARELVKLPGTIANVEMSRLYVQNPISGMLNLVTQWNDSGTEISTFNYDCQECLKVQVASNLLFSPCMNESTADNEPFQGREFCLPIYYTNSLFALIQFKLRVGESLLQNQIEIFENIKPELALALKVSQEQKKFSELRLAETALAERHSVSTYLHDHLSQNLAYLCLKLDQFTKEEELLPAEYKQIELEQMKDAAIKSYDILRDMIEIVHPETTPRLTNLFKEHAKKISNRAHFAISIEKSGEPLPIPPEVQKAVFYVFQEALSNVEKHARAQNVNVSVDWGKDCLTVTISDDGVGFDPQKLNDAKHLGLEIMQERIDKINGKIKISSFAASGTVIEINVPISVPTRREN